MFSGHIRIKLEIHKRNLFVKFPNIWKINNVFLYNPLFKLYGKSQGKLENIFNKIKLPITGMRMRHYCESCKH